jgi:hypothetical protein
VPDLPFLVASCSGGWCIGLQKEDGSLEPLSYAWPSEEEATAFFGIARPELGFIPSALPGKEKGG